jgi:hypothetical protein
MVKIVEVYKGHAITFSAGYYWVLGKVHGTLIAAKITVDKNL